MHIERLTKLAELLEKVQPEKFDLSEWRNPCGTTACACGHAGMDPWFYEQGFQLTLAKDGYNQDRLSPRYYTFKGWKAVREFFDLDYTQSEYLFVNEYYSRGGEGLLDVARRIRYFIQGIHELNTGFMRDVF